MGSSKPFLLPAHADELEHERSSSAMKRRAYAALVLLVLTAAALMLSVDAAFPIALDASSSSLSSTSPPRPRPPPPQPPLPKFPSPSCMHFVGGGAARPGGAFPQPRQRSPRCWPSIRRYFESGAYSADVAEAVGDAREVLRFYSRPSRDLVLVFDIDETSLSNAEEWMGSSERGEGGGGGAEREEENPLLSSFDLDPLSALERRALLASSPPLRATLDLYRDAYAAGFSVAFVTGRTDRAGMREATVKNLEEAGFGKVCGDDGGGASSPSSSSSSPSPPSASASPCYLSLTMRAPGDVRPASVYKPEARANLITSGSKNGNGNGIGGGSGSGSGRNLTLVASLGDQFSDLVGSAGAHASFKLPNPVYAIL